MTMRKPPWVRRVVLLAAAVLAAPALATSARAADVTAFDSGLRPIEAVAGLDGSMWALPGVPYWLDGFAHLTPDGVVTRHVLEPPVLGRSDLFPLADGTLAGVTATGNGTDPRGRTVLTFSADGTVRRRALPSALAHAAGATIEPDGTVWAPRSCEDRLDRVTPSGRLTRFKLRRFGCGHVDEWVRVETAQAIRRGVDGSTWLVNQCQGRVVRIGRDDRVREWRVPSRCMEDLRLVVQPSAVLVEPDGGIRLPGVRISPAGRVGRASEATSGTVTTDGSMWSLSDQGDVITQLAPSGQVRNHAIPELLGGRFATQISPGPDGRLWLLAGAFRRGDLRSGEGPVTVASIAPDGAVATTALPDWPRTQQPSIWATSLTLGSDGAIWVAEYGSPDSVSAEPPTQRLVRIRPDGVPAGLQTRVMRVLGQDRARLWLQLSCAAAPGRWCLGSARVTDPAGRSLARRPLRFAVPAGARVGVATTLTARAVRDLRKSPLRARVQLTTDRGQSARQTITIPRAERSQLPRARRGKR